MALKIWLPLNKDYKYIYDGVKKDLTVTNHQIKSFASPIGSYADYNVSTSGRLVIPQGENSIKGKNNASACIWAYNFKTSSQCLFNIFKSNAYFAFGIWSNGYFLRTEKTGDNNSTTYGPQRFIELGTPQINTWVHYAITFDNGLAKGYVNGNFVGSGLTFQGDSLLTDSNICTIGGYNTTYPFSGYLCDFRVYDNTLTEEDVKRIYQQKLFELVPCGGAKDVLFDRSGFMNMPLVNNGAIFQNNALYFNGSAKLRPKNGNVGLTMDDGTLSVWFTIETASTTYQIIYIDSVSKFAIGYVKGSNAFITTCNGTGSKTCFKATDVKFDGSINNVIVSYNTGKTPQFLLVNGIQAVTTTSDVWTESSGLTIGSRMYNSAQSGFKGKLLKVGAYNRQFTQDEAVELYNSERGMFLPDDYIQLEYIEATGTQWINTESKFNPQTDSFKVTFKGNDTTNNGMIIGTLSTDYIWLYYYNDGAGIHLYVGNTITQERIPGISPQDLVVHTAEFKNKHFYFDGVDNGCLTNKYIESTHNVYLFSRGTSNPFKGRIYYADFKRNGVYNHIFIPAKRKSDNVIGMYDMVSRQFFTNSGTGSFTGE